MVRKKNQGFSLIEVIVAVAILTILMAPIIRQVIQSLQTSAQAKERQYAVENAEYILNFMQETPVSKLNVLSSKFEDTEAEEASSEEGATPATPVAKTASIDGSDLVFTGCQTVPQSCNLWVGTAATPIKLEDYLKVDAFSEGDAQDRLQKFEVKTYTARTYTLANTTLGRKDKEYQRKVIVDNLRAVVAQNGCTIETKFDEGAKNYLSNDTNKFKFTTEGAAVKYDETTGLVTDIVVTKVDGLRSPNGDGISYMQDLDSSKVAIIQGVASNFDAQAENDLYNLKMNRLKVTNPEAWVQAMTQTSGHSILDGALYNDNVSKMTRISITSGKDDNGKFYNVDCTVFYEDYLIKEGNPTDAGGVETDASEGITDEERDKLVDKTAPEVLTYNAYSKKFYTNQAPDIYFVYEPYVANSSEYSNRDYILTYDGVLYGEKEKHSKLYIIKPNKGRVVKYKKLESKPEEWDQYYYSYYEKSGEKYLPVSETEEGKTPEWKVDTYYERTQDYTTTLTSEDENKVSVYLNYLESKDPSKGVTNVLPIFTNIDSDVFKFALPGNAKEGVQYSDNRSKYYGVEKSSADTESGGTYALSDIKRTKYDPAVVLDVKKDTTQTDRVYTVTVQLDKLQDGEVYSGYSVRLSGAKGAD